MIFTRATDIKTHANESHKEMTFKCSVEACNYKANGKEDLKEHLEAHKIPNKFSLQKSGWDGPNKCSSCKNGLCNCQSFRKQDLQIFSFF